MPCFAQTSINVASLKTFDDYRNALNQLADQKAALEADVQRDLKASNADEVAAAWDEKIAAETERVQYENRRKGES